MEQKHYLTISHNFGYYSDFYENRNQILQVEAEIWLDEETPEIDVWIFGSFRTKKNISKMLTNSEIADIKEDEKAIEKIVKNLLILNSNEVAEDLEIDEISIFTAGW